MPTRRPDPVRERLPWLIASLAVTVAAALVFVVVDHSRWNTWLFVWGLAIGVTGVLQTELLLHYARGRVQTVDNSPEARERLRFRQRFNAVTALVFGVVIGLIAGAGDLLWFDALMTGLAVVVWVPTTFLALRLVRGARPAG